MNSILNTNIGAYRVVQALGQGAFGIVYRAYQPFLDRQVAIKTLHTKLLMNSTIEQQFMQEARTIARLRHPNIVSVYEFGTVSTENNPFTYMVMEYLPGETLFQVLKKGLIPLEDTVSIINQLAQALDYAHSNNVIHRDLKPANIIFDAQNRPVIVDFGLAKLLELGSTDIAPTDMELTSSGGTPAYMSPEQCQGEPVGPASDQYSLATIAYEMLTAQRLFEGENVAVIFHTRLTEAPKSLSVGEKKFPPLADLVMQRALQRNPAARYSKATDFANALSEALLPNEPIKQVITILDPVQAALLRQARQTVLGFMWGLVAVTLVAILFSTSDFVGGFLNAESPFVWDGIIASSSMHDGGRDVTGVWPGSPAERAGIHPGDFVKNDITIDQYVKFADFKIDGKPRSEFPIKWLPQDGDQIERTIFRNGQPIVVHYTLELSTFLLQIFAVHIPSALVGLFCAVWLLRRWKGEPRLQLFIIVLLAGSFALVASAVSSLLVDIDSFAFYILLSLLLHFVLTFPEPIGNSTSRMLLWLYLPALIGLAEFMIRRDIMVADVSIDTVTWMIYAVVLIIVVIGKWVRRDLKRHRDLWLAIAMLVIVSAIAVISAIVFFFDDYKTVQALWGDGIALYRFTYLSIALGSLAAILTGFFSVHRIQLRYGLTLQEGEPSYRTIIF